MFHFSVQDPIPCNKQFKINYRKKRFSKFTTGLELSIILIITRKNRCTFIKDTSCNKKNLLFFHYMLSDSSLSITDYETQPTVSAKERSRTYKINPQKIFLETIKPWTVPISYFKVFWLYFLFLFSLTICYFYTVNYVSALT